MRVEIVQGGRVLRTRRHLGQVYAEVPGEGDYVVRLSNESHRRRLAIVSVDGANVVNAEAAGFDGPGYVVGPWQTVEIPGYRRSDASVAKFCFGEREDSYVAKVGRGTANVGVIGVAVFDEKVERVVPSPPVVIKEIHHHHHPRHTLADLWGPPWVVYGTGVPRGTGVTFSSNALSSPLSFDDDSFSLVGAVPAAGQVDAAPPSQERERGGVTRSRAKAVGTVYGSEATFHTTTTDFVRSTSAPALVIAIRYGTRDQLVSWGVPIDQEPSTLPNAFPTSIPAVPAPPGWRG